LLLSHPPYSSKPAPWNFLPLSAQNGLAENLSLQGLLEVASKIVLQEVAHGGIQKYFRKL
jgi:hypothetical protein